MRLWVALMLALVLSVCAVAHFAGRLLVVADPLPARADAIVIMAGSVPDRVLEVADLYQAGLAPLIVVTRERLPRGEAALRARGVRFPESADLTITALTQLGVPASAIVRLRRRDHSTVSETRTIARFACRQGLRRLVVVTSRVHGRRARMILRRALEPAVAVTIHPTRYDTFTGERWWRVRRDAKYVLNEWQKLAHYWLRERQDVLPCGGLSPRPARVSGVGDRLPQERRELTARMHLAHDVTAADELAGHVDLGNRRPA
jgi:uncharacterized SAM-binding protein YcdF (DUF218 family)